MFSAIENAVAPLKGEGVITDTVRIPPSLAEARYDDKRSMLERVRVAAARFGADAVLVVNIYNDDDWYVNPLSILYVTIAGMWIVPGTHLDVISLSEGYLVDVRNEYLYLNVMGKGHASTVRPLMYIDEQTISDRATHKAIEKLGHELAYKLRDFNKHDLVQQKP